MANSCHWNNVQPVNAEWNLHVLTRKRFQDTLCNEDPENFGWYNLIYVCLKVVCVCVCACKNRNISANKKQWLSLEYKEFGEEQGRRDLYVKTYTFYLKFFFYRENVLMYYLCLFFKENNWSNVKFFILFEPAISLLEISLREILTSVCRDRPATEFTACGL